MPAYKIIFTSSMIEFVADAIVVGSSISFSWEKELSLIHVGECQPPAYVNSTLPPGIDPTQYLQGDVDYAEVYNYGLPMADGLVGGWAGWPVSNPLNSFQIQSEGPVYVIQVLCDNGIYRPDIDNGLGTSVKSHVIEHDSRSLFLEIETTFPPSSVWDDISNSSVPVSVVQTCSSLVTVGYGAVSFQFVVDQWQMVIRLLELNILRVKSNWWQVTNGQMQSVNSLDGSFKAKYPTSIQQYTDQAHNVFKHYDDKFGILPLMTESIMSLFRNATYFPSQGATFCNILSEGTLPDGFYHTETTYRGISTGVPCLVDFFRVLSHNATLDLQELASPLTLQLCNINKAFTSLVTTSATQAAAVW
ncbi:hypothetical protein BC830DRAFT_718147 [Chytriomyces sp. MP71]|nr:hypothetical protein BC830DRAFT_718147 [Chytriomyces sp. MP71]